MAPEESGHRNERSRHYVEPTSPLVALEHPIVVGLTLVETATRETIHQGLQQSM